MPLHLLGKKSWNVYNSASIERVRRDEAEAKAREEAAEQRMQEEDAARRIAILRGEEPPPLPPTEAPEEDAASSKRAKEDETYSQRDRKRRRLHGEDDTDRDIRYAKLDTSSENRSTQSLVRGKATDAPLQDHAGNISLIPAPEPSKQSQSDSKSPSRRHHEDPTLRFSNAAGNRTSTSSKPWYSSHNTSDSQQNFNDKDVWGNPDPLRASRESARITSSDPFAAMQAAQKQLKQSERDREAWQKKQRAEMEELKRQEKRQRGRDKDDEVDSLEGFKLDAPSAASGRTDNDKDIAAEVEIAVEIAVETGTAMGTVTSVVGVEIKIETGTARENVRDITAEADIAVTPETNERNHLVMQAR